MLYKKAKNAVYGEYYKVATESLQHVGTLLKDKYEWTLTIRTDFLVLSQAELFQIAGKLKELNKK